MIDKSYKFNAFIKLAKQASKIILISHKDPDRDAIGSTLSLYWILIKLGFKNVFMINESTHNIKNGFLEGLELIDFETNLAKYAEDDSLVICLDASPWERISSAKQSILSKSKVIVIDHHQTITDINYDLYIHEILSSNCQIIYEIFENEIEIDQKIAKPLIMGMYDDTGAFSYRGVDSRTFEIASILLGHNVEITDISVESKSIELDLFQIGKEFYDNLYIDKINKFYFTYLSYATVLQHRLSYTQIEKMKELYLKNLIAIEELDWGILAKPKESDIFSLSFRSKPDIDVAKIAQYFGGGGHKNASGAKIKSNEDMLKSKVFDILSKNKLII